jgi:hypothetical protein
MDGFGGAGSVHFMGCLQLKTLARIEDIHV